MFHLGGRQCLGEDVGHHVISGAVDESYVTLLNNPADPMIMHVDVLGLWMVLVVMCECDGSLVIGKESGGGSEVAVVGEARAITYTSKRTYKSSCTCPKA